jgi:hypothetical protein
VEVVNAVREASAKSPRDEAAAVAARARWQRAAQWLSVARANAVAALPKH